MTISKVWVTSDLHLGHGKVAKSRGFESIEEHDECILNNLSCVGKQDTLILLGDLAFGAPEDKNKSILKLNKFGKYRRCILGNHDIVSDIYFEVFTSIQSHRVIGEGFILSHIPVHESQLETRWYKNIHGHLHSNKLNDSRYICVSLEQNNLKPFLLNDLL
jgi:calcineurin-like phosphoesterase family protein